MVSKYSSFEIILPVYNEAQAIKYVIDYLLRWAPLLIIDNFSTDETLEIIDTIKSDTIRTVQIANNGTIQTPEWFGRVLPLVNTRYVVVASCSELLPPQLFSYFNQIACHNSVHLVSTPVVTYTCGFYTPLWGASACFGNRYIQRFFAKDALDFDSIRIHSQFTTKCGYNSTVISGFNAAYSILHLRSSDWVSLANKHLGYALVDSEQRFRDGRSITAFKLTILLFLELFRMLRGLLVGPKAPFFIVYREILARIVMYISIHVLGLESKYSMGPAYSQRQNIKMWTNAINLRPD